MQTLCTLRLQLEPLTAAHAAEMFSVLADPAIYEFENEPPASADWLQSRYARLETRRSADGSEIWLNWVARQTDSRRAIGYVQATLFDDRSALIAYELASAHWGRGYASEAVDAVLHALSSEYEAQIAGAVFKKANFRSRRLLQRLGMQPAHPPAFPSAFAAADEDAMHLPLAMRAG